VHKGIGLLLVAFLFGCSNQGAKAVVQPTATQQDCHVIELVEDNPRYNALVCQGVDQMTAGRGAEAVKTFERAMNESLFEFPNFKLFSRLALAYFRTGDRAKAIVALKKAELSLSVLIGAARCEEAEMGFRVVDNGGVPLDAEMQADIAGRMCGAAYDYVYSQRTLESVLSDARLIESYYQSREEIEGGGVK
jgi:hypothetical protein